MNTENNMNEAMSSLICCPPMTHAWLSLRAPGWNHMALDRVSCGMASVWVHGLVMPCSPTPIMLKLASYVVELRDDSRGGEEAVVPQEGLLWLSCDLALIRTHCAKAGYSTCTAPSVCGHLFSFFFSTML